MAKRCPKCGTMNDDEMVFCGACTEPLNDDVKLVMRVDEMAKEMREHSHTDRPMERQRERDQAPTGARTVHDEEAKQLNIKKKDEKEGGSANKKVIIIAIVAVLVIAIAAGAVAYSPVKKFHTSSSSS